MVDAAVELLNGESALSISMENIARAAGVTRPTVYAHFPKIGDIVGAVVDLLRPALSDGAP